MKIYPIAFFVLFITGYNNSILPRMGPITSTSRIEMVNKKATAITYDVAESINENSICFITPEAGKSINPPVIISECNEANPYTENFIVLTPHSYDQLAFWEDIKKLRQRITVPFLSFSGSHGNYGTFFGHEIKGYVDNVVTRLADKGFKAKIIVLDACLTLSILPAFIQILAPNGIIIAQAANSSGAFITQEIGHNGKTINQAIKSGLTNDIYNFKNPEDQEKLSTLIQINLFETFANDESKARLKEILPPSEYTDIIEKDSYITNTRALAQAIENNTPSNTDSKTPKKTVNIEKQITKSCSTYVIYINGRIHYDANLENGFGQLFKKDDKEFLSDSFKKCCKKCESTNKTFNKPYSSPVTNAISFVPEFDFIGFTNEMFPDNE